MWVTTNSLERIDAALGEGPRPDIDRLLAEVLAEASSTEPTPTGCAVCRRDLTRSSVGRPRVLIYSCPDGHGSWLDGDGVAALRRVLHERAAPHTPGSPTPAPPVSRRLAALSGLLVASLAVLTGTIMLSSPAGPMPVAERRYFAELIVVLDDGIVNRRNIDGVLKSRSRPDTYVSAFEIYRVRQERFLRRLDTMNVPPRLRPIHERIRTAAQGQTGFYRDFTEARTRNPAGLPDLLGHPDLRQSDYDLHRAWDLIRETYPILDPRLAEAIESRLCHLDII